jgi:hypothetical protein
MISETWSTINIKRYSLFRKDRAGKRGGGVFIYEEESIKSYCISNVNFTYRMIISNKFGTQSNREWKNTLWILLPHRRQQCELLKRNCQINQYSKTASRK